MDSITEQLSQLQELSDEQLSELENSVLSEFEATESQDVSPQVVDQLEQLANAVEAVRTEKSRRVAAMEALSAKAIEAAQRVHGAEELTDGQETDAEDEAPEDIPAEVAPSEDDEELKATLSSEDVESTTMQEPTEASLSTETAETIIESEAVVETATELAPEPAALAPEPNIELAPDPVVDAPEPAAEVEEPSEEVSEEAPVDETEAETEIDEDTTDEAPASDEENQESMEATVTAAAQGTGESPQIEPPADRRPQLKPTATMSITAGADIPGISAGTKFNDMLSVADAFSKRLHTLRHVHGGDGEQHIVASLQYEFPEERKLAVNDPSENTGKIFAVTSPESITAAAGVCLPLETRYDLGCDVGVTDRPVRDALARFGSDRGGIRFFSAPALVDMADATGYWRSDGTGANWHTFGPDRTTATSPADQKPCLEVQCATEDTAYIEAVTLCLTFNNLTTRAFPEIIKRHNDLALVAHARVAENGLLAQLKAGSTAITAQAQVVGAAREIFSLLGRAVASVRHKHRMNAMSPLRMIAPMWVMDLLRADIAMQMPGDGLDDVFGLAEAQVNAWFRARNVNIAWHLDGVGPAVGDLDDGGAGTAVGFEWPTSIEFALFPEGTWLYLDGGTLDIGVIRDSSLVSTNQYKQFVETFEGVANVGCESYWVTAAYEACGSAAALVETCA